MSSIHADNVTKPVEGKPEPFPDAEHAQVANALTDMVERTATHPDVTHGIHSPVHKAASHIPFIGKFIPSLEKIAVDYHCGNYVKVRGTDEKFFESMPIYPRLGMHLLYYGAHREQFLRSKEAEKVLKDLSVREGKIFDSPESVKNIPSFISTYSIQLAELANPDVHSYTTFNKFFYRELKPDARPVQNADKPGSFCSGADSRLTVYPTVDAAKKFWIKGNEFTISNLLGVAPDSEEAKTFEGASIAIFRLAPADYHRFHSPVDGTVGEVRDIPGEYYTVNPQAVNEPDFDVFTTNRRAVLHMTLPNGKPFAFVAVGAMLVGSIVWTNGGTPGKVVTRGEELGYFAYGGSTCIALFPPGVINFDKDLLQNSEEPIETLVKVGYSLGVPATL